MTSSVRLLHFFVLEATDYIDRLDRHAHRCASRVGGARCEALRRRRNLRGSATMSRQMGIAELSSAVERLARALRNRRSSGTRRQRRGRVRNRRSPHSRARDPHAGRRRERARARGEELGEVCAAGCDAATRAQAARGAPSSPASPPSSRARSIIRWARTTIRPRRVPPSACARCAASRSSRTSRRSGRRRGGREHAQDARAGPFSHPTTKAKTLLSASAAILRRVARDIALARPAPRDLGARVVQGRARGGIGGTGRADRIVPIAQLFHDDEGPHILTTAPQPPTSAAERFRLEVVSLAEHLRGVVAQARANRAPEQRERNQRELRAALRALGSAANSLRREAGRALCRRMERSCRDVERRADGGPRSRRVAARESRRRVRRKSRADSSACCRATAARRSTGIARRAHAYAARRFRCRRDPTRTPAPTARSRSRGPGCAQRADDAPRQPATRTPTGRQLRDYLQNGIAGFGALEATPLSTPVVLPDEAIVPIESLLYRGHAALARARELKSEMLAERTPPRETIEELFDLLDLAIAD